jgi:hypothetical protein
MQITEDEVDQQVADSQKAIESLESSVPHRIVKFNWFNTDGSPLVAEYSQEELGFFGVQEFTTLTTDSVRELTREQKDEFGNVISPGLKISELFSNTDLQKQMANPTTFDVEQLEKTVDQNEKLINGFLSLIKMLPGYQQEVLCMSLGVPRNNREWVKLQFQEPVSRGGLSVKDGFDLINTFIIQNAPVIRDFFAGQGKQLIATFQEHVLQQTPAEDETTTEVPKAAPASLGGTPSSTSSPDIQENV